MVVTSHSGLLFNCCCYQTTSDVAAEPPVDKAEEGQEDEVKMDVDNQEQGVDESNKIRKYLKKIAHRNFPVIV